MAQPPSYGAPRACLAVLCGLPAAGKSTLCARLLRECGSSTGPRVSCIAFDELVRDPHKEGPAADDREEDEVGPKVFG